MDGSSDCRGSAEEEGAENERYDGYEGTHGYARELNGKVGEGPFPGGATNCVRGPHHFEEEYSIYRVMKWNSIIRGDYHTINLGFSTTADFLYPRFWEVFTKFFLQGTIHFKLDFVGDFETSIPSYLNYHLFTIIYFGEIDIFSLLNSVPKNTYSEENFSFLVEPSQKGPEWENTGVWEIQYNIKEEKLENFWVGPIYGVF